jgi:regulator of replication initiation timing
MEENNLEWWQSFDGILGKVQELKEENEKLKAENVKLKKRKPRKRKTTNENNDNN